MTGKVKFLPAHQYDQAGLMVRAGGNCWIKTSVEHEDDEPPKLGVVVTNGGYSDWSVQNFDPARNELWLRISRKNADFVVEHSQQRRKLGTAPDRPSPSRGFGEHGLWSLCV